MKEIKCRAWDKENNVMLSWADIDIMDSEGWERFMDMLHNERYDVMLYTGLKDMNGKEAFYKDLWMFQGVIYTVEGDDEYAMFYLKHSGKEASSLDHLHMYFLQKGEIIGNIYEHSHLLEANT